VIYINNNKKNISHTAQNNEIQNICIVFGLDTQSDGRYVRHHLQVNRVDMERGLACLQLRGGESHRHVEHREGWTLSPRYPVLERQLSYGEPGVPSWRPLPVESILILLVPTHGFVFLFLLGSLLGESAVWGRKSATSVWRWVDEG